MMQRITAPLLLAGLAAGLSGCNLIYAGLVLGLKDTPPATPARLAADGQRYHVPPAQTFVLDTSYLTFLRRQPAARHESAKNHAQPLQLLYFDQAGALESFHINCYAKFGFPHLRWNADNRFGTFPPATQTPPDSLLSFARLLTFLRTPTGQPVPAGRFAAPRRRAVIFWSRTMGRQTEVLLHELEQNLLRAAPNEPVDVLYVNNDALLGLIY